MAKVVLITGASSGMGKATAKRLIKDGHVVYGAARRVDNMRELATLGGRTLKLDVTDPDDVKSAVRTIVQENGCLDVLVNNAGYSVYGSVEEVSDADAKRQFDVNLFGAAAMVRAVLPIMRQQGFGHILNVTSVAGKIGWPLGAWYHASKHALEGWSDSLRMEVKQFGIDVTIVEPGAINSEFADVMNGPLIERSQGGPYDSLMQGILQANKSAFKGRGTQPEIIAHVISRALSKKRPKTRYAAGKAARLVLFLRGCLSDRAFDRFVLGQLNVDEATYESRKD